MHIRRCAQPKGVAVAVLPDHFVGERFTGEVKHFALFGKVGQGQSYVGEVGASDHIHAFSCQELFSRTHRVAWVGVVFSGEEFEFASIDPAARVDLFDGELHAFFIGLQKSGLGFVAVDLPDLKTALSVECERQRRCPEHQKRGNPGAVKGHGGTPKSVILSLEWRTWCAS